VPLCLCGEFPFTQLLDFAYDDVQARALSVDSRGILEALDKVYGVRDLVKELKTGKRGR